MSVGNYLGDDFEITVIKDIQDKNKTAFIGPTLSFWVNQNGLVKVLEQKLKDKPEQIKKADIICFYSFHAMFDFEDFCGAITTITKQNQIACSNKKKFLCFTPWNSGQLSAIFNNLGTWSGCDVDSVFSYK